MADIKMINNYNIKDETARNEIEAIRAQIPDAAIATEGYVEQYVNENTPYVPTEVSELNNDAGYLTEHQDISHLALKSEIPEVPSIEGLATKDELNDAIGDINTILDNINGEEI